MEPQNEANPFMGFRAIRYCLSNQMYFGTTSCNLAVNAHGNVRIMLPMILELGRLLGQELIAEAMEELEAGDSLILTLKSVV